MNTNIISNTQILEGISSLSLEDINPKDRYSLVVRGRLRRSIFEHQQKEIEGNEFFKCSSCFLIKKSYCICPKLSEFSNKICNLPFNPKIRFIILMHDREFFKSSNTGKLINLIVPESEVLIHGISEHSQKLKELISQNLMTINETIILFPGKDSSNLNDCLETIYKKYFVDFSDKKELLNTKLENFDKNIFFKNLYLNVILIDGTWSQAKSINKCLPTDIPRVIINRKQISDFGPLRKQNKIGNISTIESASLFLIELKEIIDLLNRKEICTNNMKEVAELLNESLKILIIHVIAQCKREYIKDILEKRNEKKLFKNILNQEK